jgi:hypothetical protein
LLAGWQQAGRSSGPVGQLGPMRRREVTPTCSEESSSNSPSSSNYNGPNGKGKQWVYTIRRPTPDSKLGIQVGERTVNGVVHVIILSMVPGSPAANSGLETHDVILEVAGHKVKQTAQVMSLLAMSNGNVDVRIQARGGGSGNSSNNASPANVRGGARPSRSPLSRQRSSPSHRSGSPLARLFRSSSHSSSSSPTVGRRKKQGEPSWQTAGGDVHARAGAGASMHRRASMVSPRQMFSTGSESEKLTVSHETLGSGVQSDRTHGAKGRFFPSRLLQNRTAKKPAQKPADNGESRNRSGLLEERLKARQRAIQMVKEVIHAPIKEAQAEEALPDFSGQWICTDTEGEWDEYLELVRAPPTIAPHGRTRLAALTPALALGPPATLPACLPACVARRSRAHGVRSLSPAAAGNRRASAQDRARRAMGQKYGGGDHHHVWYATRPHATPCLRHTISTPHHVWYATRPHATPCLRHTMSGTPHTPTSPMAPFASDARDSWLTSGAPPVRPAPQAVCQCIWRPSATGRLPSMALSDARGALCK